MIEGDFSLQAKLSQHAKDVRIILEEARRGGISLPVSAAALANSSPKRKRPVSAKSTTVASHSRANRGPSDREQGANDAAGPLSALRNGGYWNECILSFCRAPRRSRFAMPRTTRRTFLKSAVAGAAALSLPALRPRAAQRQRRSPLRRSSAAASAATRSSSGPSMVCDPDQSRLDAAAKSAGLPSAQAVTDFRRILDDKPTSTPW